MLAKAVSYEKPKKSSDYGTFKFEVVKVLKGAWTDKFIYEEGVENNQSWGPEDDFSFQKGDTGPCNAVDLKSGQCMCSSSSDSKKNGL